MKYDIFKYGDEGTWQKRPDEYSQRKIVDSYLPSKSWTSSSQKKLSQWKNINTRTHTHTHTHTHTRSSVSIKTLFIKKVRSVRSDKVESEYYHVQFMRANDLALRFWTIVLKNTLNSLTESFLLHELLQTFFILVGKIVLIVFQNLIELDKF